jgi:GxxExxY protein
MQPKDAPKINQDDKKFRFDPIPINTEGIAKIILDAAYQVHTALGPGLLESVYEACLVHELRLKNIKVRSQISLPVMYKGIEVDSGYRLDILVEDCVIVEIKSSDIITPVHCAQLLTYLKLSNIRLGLLLNFNVVHLRNGIKRIIN